jgi:hypothetical protein
VPRPYVQDQASFSVLLKIIHDWVSRACGWATQ